MRKRNFILAVSVVFFLLSLFLCVRTAVDKREMNAYRNDTFTYAELSDGEVDLTMRGGTTVRLYFGNRAVTIRNSYRIKSRTEQVYLVAFVYSYGRKTDIGIERHTADMLGELRLHNALYAVGYRRKNTADADLDFDRDKRWYVNFISSII